MSKTEIKMQLSERQKELLEIIRSNSYISVNELAEETFTSPSSIRRDLNKLQNLGLVKRLHGGASLTESDGSVAGFYRRATKNIKEKRLIAKKAASLLQNGQSILLDSSTTAGFLLPYIAKLESPTVFTNNLETAVGAINLGIQTHCLGGCAVNGSVSLGGAQTYKALSELNVDILFFSSQSLSRDGVISDSTEAENFVRMLMLDRAKRRVFLCDSSKFGNTSTHTLTTLDSLDFAVFDRPFEGLETKITVI
jgi:DeoR family fructose operon transcriptional repressor